LLVSYYFPKIVDYLDGAGLFKNATKYR
jgi:hypothetical protein